MDALLETLCQENHFETILGPFLTLSDYPVICFDQKIYPPYLFQLSLPFFMKKFETSPDYLSHTVYLGLERNRMQFFQILQCKLQCNVSTCFFLFFGAVVIILKFDITQNVFIFLSYQDACIY